MRQSIMAPPLDFFSIFLCDEYPGWVYDLMCGASIYLHTRALEKHVMHGGFKDSGAWYPPTSSVVWLPERVMTRCHDFTCDILMVTLGPGHCFPPEDGVWERTGFRYVDNCR